MTDQATITLHGVFMEVSGFGVLLRGNSAIGKSEMALSLINRGHRLVADDAVDIKQVAPETLIGSCPPLLQDFLEVRGLGIINIRIMFGDNAIKDSKRLQLIIKMAAFDENELKQIDRLHGMYRVETILGTTIPEVTIPVAPGRNLAVLIETAVRNQVLKHNGYDAPHEFITRQQQFLRDKDNQ
ncbi:MAG: HPr(Ser) kinase/phosphatase [Gammaproteobacteria bacterium]|nr:HPr(Ser) kinase/phosphatase [Gammaproteobacteria bacterium]